MARVKQNLLLLAANILIPLGILIFFAGFFRGSLKTSTKDVLETSEIQVATLDSAPFDKVVFMMIDALRSDFVYAENSGFNFTQSLIRSGAAIPFTALAASPTLTLSRIKALTQGTSQSVLDALLNVLHSADARRLEGEDTWLSRLKKEKDVEKKMVFYGVDMWTMLYPDIWDRYETVDSFYLPDFTTVDRNITRNLPDELEDEGWKALVLHYVGLDNIAHFGGSKGSYMLPKQIEMDSIVRQVFEAIEQKSHLRNTLLVLLGDHGMNEKGNHGGDTPSEIASALTFMSPRFKSISMTLESPIAATKGYEYYTVVNQIDIVPTLASLVGFSIPVSSVGIFIPQFLGLWQSPDDRLQILLKNAKQMMGVFERKYDRSAIGTASCANYCEDCPSQESRVLCFWEAVKRAEEDQNMFQNTSSEDLTRAINDFSDCAQQCLSVPLNNLSILYLLAGIACMATLILLLTKGYELSKAPWDSGSIFFVMFTALHVITMFRSRLVMEEHLYWYWASLHWLGYLGLKRAVTGEYWLKSACPIVLQFLSQCFNPTGDVSYSTVDYVHDVLFEYPIFLWALASMSWIFAVITVSKHLGMGSLASLVTSNALGFLGLTFKICSTQAFNPELVNFIPLWLEDFIFNLDRNYGLRILWTSLIACIIKLLVQSTFAHGVSRKVTMGGVIKLASFYIRSQTRPKNLALYSIFDFQLEWLLSPGAELSPSEIAVTTLLLSQSSFYAGGRNNSFDSFDMMNGYNGIDHTNNDFYVLAVSLQTILSNWLGPVWWSLASLRMLLAWLEANGSQAEQSSKSRMSSANSAFNSVVEKDNELTFNSEAHFHSNDIRLGALTVSLTNDEPASSTENRNAGIGQHRRPFFEQLTLHSMFTASSTLAVMLACIRLQDDPALWTVLAPKYVNAALWALFHHFMINVILCTGIWCAVVR